MMRSRTLRSAWALAVAAGIVGIWVGLFVRRGERSLEGDAWAPALAIAFTTVGVLIVERRPGNNVGRLCFAAGLAFGLSVLLAIGVALVDIRPGPLPGAFAILTLVSDCIEIAAITLGLPLLMIRFPDGRLPSPRWRVIDVLSIAGVALMWSKALRPGPISADWILPVDNPIGIVGAPIDLIEGIGYAGATAVGVALLMSAIAVIRRYRRADGIVRAQIRWVAAAIALAAAGLVAILLPPPIGEVAWLVPTVAPAFVPIGIGVAVLRYRLYEIDRIVSRALVYAVLTGMLAAVFIVVSLVLSALLAQVLPSQSAVVAAATLVVATLFAPLRARIQATVDRRFHRARYDAEATSAAFAERLRDQIQLSALRRELLAVVLRSMQPSSACVWLRARPVPDTRRRMQPGR